MIKYWYWWWIFGLSFSSNNHWWKMTSNLLLILISWKIKYMYILFIIIVILFIIITMTTSYHCLLFWNSTCTPFWKKKLGILKLKILTKLLFCKNYKVIPKSVWTLISKIWRILTSAFKNLWLMWKFVIF